MLAAALLVLVLGPLGSNTGPLRAADAFASGPNTQDAAVPASSGQPDARKSEQTRRRRPAVAPGDVPLTGLPGAATALTIKDYERSLRLAKAVDPGPEGAEKWFWVGAIRGRALLRLGKPAEAIAELAPRWEHRQLTRRFPKDAIGFELARARVEHARAGTLPVADADAELRRALKVLSRIRRHEPLRTTAPIRVLHAEAMLGIQGTSPHAKKVAALRAVKAVKKVLGDYPRHPRAGQLWLEQARAVERTGKAKEAAAEFRAIHIHRAGEPEGEQAWKEYERVMLENPRLRHHELNVNELLARAQAARRLRRVELSREILDKLADDEAVPKHRRESAKRSRAWTAYKQRDFDQCIADVKPVYEGTGNLEARSQLLRCLERGAHYDEAIEILLEDTKSKRRGARASAYWSAVGLAIKGGLYAKAKGFIEEYEKISNGHRQTRTWLHAWIAMRTGDREHAIEGFEASERYRSDRTRARYYRGSLLVASEKSEQRSTGAALLKEVAQRDPLGYYGLMARQRMLDAKLKPPPAPELEPLATDGKPISRAQKQALLDDLDAEFGKAWPPVRRARQLFAAGYIEEARRELRVAVHAFITRGKKSGGVRSEAIEVGLGWKPVWKFPRVAPTRSGRKTLRTKESANKLKVGLRTLAHALDEPYRFVKLSDPSLGPYKARWHPRAYKAALEREARLRKIDVNHLWALMYTESRFRRFVVSPVGARGALQIMPWTARQLAERLDELPTGAFDDDALFDIDTNAHLASYYVYELLDKFHGQAPMAYASYNGGPSNVARWLAAKSKSPAPLRLDAFIEEIPFRESQRYTKRVMEVHAAYALMYDGDLPRWTNKVDAKFKDNISF